MEHPAERAAILDRSLGDDGRRRVDDQTWHDLDMDRVFERVDRTQSVVGAHQLYATLRRPQSEALPVCSEYAASALAKLPRDIGWWTPTLIYGAAPDTPVPRLVLVGLPVALVGSAAGASFFAPLWALAGLAFLASVLVHFRVQKEIGVLTSSLQYLGAVIGLAKAVARRPGGEHLRPLVRATEGIIARTWSLALRDPFEIVTYIKIVTLTEARGYAACIQIIRRERSALQALYCAVGALDVAQAVAQLRAEGYGRPTRGGARLEVRGLGHPLLDAPELNDLSLDDRGCLITGLNMSGKTTFIKALGVGAILAESLDLVRADRWHGPSLAVATALDVHDDLVAGRSYYLSEVKAVARLVELSRTEQRWLFLLDETFRGTNSIERVAAASAVLRDLAQHQWVVAATHDMALCDLVEDRYDLLHFSDTVDGAGVKFDYRLRPGRCPATNAIALLRHAGFPTAVVDEAAANADRLRGASPT